MVSFFTLPDRFIGKLFTFPPIKSQLRSTMGFLWVLTHGQTVYACHQKTHLQKVNSVFWHLRSCSATGTFWTATWLVRNFHAFIDGQKSIYQLHRTNSIRKIKKSRFSVFTCLIYKLSIPMFNLLWNMNILNKIGLNPIFCKQASEPSGAILLNWLSRFFRELRKCKAFTKKMVKANIF